MRHLVSHGIRKLESGNIHIDVGFRKKREINARDAQIAHGYGENDLFRTNLVSGKIIGIQLAEFRIEYVGKLGKGMCGNYVPLFVPFELRRYFVERSDVIFGRFVQLFLGENSFGKSQRPERRFPLIQRRIKHPERQKDGQNGHRETIETDARLRKFFAAQQNDEKYEKRYSSGNQQHRRPFVKGYGNIVGRTAEQKTQPARNPAGEEILRNHGNICQHKRDDYRQCQRSERQQSYEQAFLFAFVHLLHPVYRNKIPFLCRNYTTRGRFLSTLSHTVGPKPHGYSDG